jgi:hypothetical protein
MEVCSSYVIFLIALLIYGPISKNFSGRFMIRENMQQYPVVIGIIHRYIQSTLDNE